MSEDHNLDRLRAKVAGHEGSARARPLIELGVVLAERYWSAGPQTLAARPLLDEAVEALDEAYDLLEPNEFLRGQVAAMLGWLIGTRHAVHGDAGGDSERDTGIRLLDEALGFPQLPGTLQTYSRLVLAQLLLVRVMRRMQGGDLLAMAMQPAQVEIGTGDADRAVALLQRVESESASSPQVLSATQTLLLMAETVQSLTAGLRGGLGGFDIGKMMQAMQSMQRLQEELATRPSGAGFGAMPNPFQFGGTAVLLTEPLRRPVMVVDGAPPAAAPSGAGVGRAEPTATPAAVLRADLLEAFPGDGQAGIAALLADGAAPPAVEIVDELAALAGALVEAPGAVGSDHLLLAVALHLRSTLDEGGGWADDGNDPLAGESLLAAAGAVALEPAGTVGVAFRLATLLDERASARKHLCGLCDGFAPVTAVLRKIGVGGLVYALPSELLLLSAETGRLGRVEGPLPDRIVVVGDGPVPDGPVTSHVTSGAQLMSLAERTPRPLTDAVVFVSNPRGDRKEATFDALTLRRTFHPRSIGLGVTAENGDGEGTPEQVRARLDASLLHLGCGIRPDGALELAGPALLEAVEIAAGEPGRVGGLAILPPASGAAALTDALLATRFTGVVGFRTPVTTAFASLTYLLLHAQLVDEGRQPADAVRAVRTWMDDPHRVVPDFVPEWCVPDDTDLLTQRRALVHHGLCGTSAWPGHRS